MKNGTQIPAVVAQCSKCHKHIMSGMFRGEVRETPGNSFRVTGIGWCVDCDLLSPFMFHIVEEGNSYKIQNLERGWWEAEQDNGKILKFERPAKKPKKVHLPVASSNSS